MTELEKKKIAHLVENLARKTTEDQIDWEESPVENAYQAKLGNYFVYIAPEYDRESDDTYHKITIRNESGRVIDEIVPGYIYNVEPEYFEDMRYYQIMEMTYEAARRKALGVDQAYRDILEILK